MIAYLRVSTDRQGRSGLGLDAQREAIRRFAEGEKLKLAGEHVGAASINTGAPPGTIDSRGPNSAHMESIHSPSAGFNCG